MTENVYCSKLVYNFLISIVYFLGFKATLKDDVMTLELPSGFCREYPTIMKGQCCDDVVFDEDTYLLAICYRAVINQFLKKTIDAIISAFRSVLQSVNDVDIIYLVGGFGGSNYVYEALQTELSTMSNDREITLLCPHLAVCHGAVIGTCILILFRVIKLMLLTELKCVQYLIIQNMMCIIVT